MIKAYINFNEPSIIVHRSGLCDQAKVGPDEKIRHVLINQSALSRELDRFRSGKHQFSEELYLNDMWLIFDLEDSDFEMALLVYLQKQIGITNSTIKNAKIQVHC